VSVATAATGPADPGRIAAQIVTGVGFLGAGTIIQGQGSVTGLTTAATLWVVAAIGMAVGLGATVEAVGTTILVLVALLPLQRLEARAYKRPIASTDTPKPADEGR
jgi:putative Mg2+ transporter-C (MgtC) family protein